MQNNENVKPGAGVGFLKSRQVKILAGVFGVSLVVVFVFWMQQSFGAHPRSELSGDVTQIRIQLFDEVGSVGQSVVIEEQSEIQQFVGLLSSGKVHPDHDCAAVGQLTVVVDDKEIDLAFLPGHDQEFYEYRYRGQNYQVDRQQWMSLVLPKGLSKQVLCNEAPVE